MEHLDHLYQNMIMQQLGMRIEEVMYFITLTIGIMDQHPPAVLEITNSRNRTIKDSVNYYFVSLVFVILLAISFCAGG